MRNLHELPRFDDRWSYLYLEHGTLDQKSSGLVFHTLAGHTPLPIGQLSLIMLGPGTKVTHEAVKALARNNCLLAWVGEKGIRLYSHSTGGTFSAKRLLVQARLASNDEQRLAVVYRMYQKRFPGTNLADKTLQQVRGMEGLRVRQAYENAAKEFDIPWKGRTYSQENWETASDTNRALSSANACLYGVCHAAIVSAGYSAAIGFVHTGKMLSFVYDVADFYKCEITVPLAFRAASKPKTRLESLVRRECQQAFHDARLLERIIPDINEVLNVGHDCRETSEELEGRAHSLADGSPSGSVPGQSQPESS